MITMTAELADAIRAAGPELTGSLVTILRATGTPGEPETELRRLLADVLDWNGVADGSPDKPLIDFCARQWNESGGAFFGGEKTGYMIRQAEGMRAAGDEWGTPMSRLYAALWGEVDSAVLAADMAGMLTGA